MFTAGVRSKVTEHAQKWYGAHRMRVRRADREEGTKMSTKVPFLARVGIYRISSEKQETLLKLLALSTAAILCECRL